MKESTLVITSVANGYQASDAWGDTTNASLHVFETFDTLVAFLRERLPVFGATFSDGTPVAAPPFFGGLGQTGVSSSPSYNFASQVPVTASELNAADPNYCELCNTSACPLPTDATGAPKF